MNILIITPEIPYPDNSGGRIYTWQRIKMLHNLGCKVYLYSFVDDENEVNYEKIKEYCEVVNIYKRDKSLLNVLKHPFLPYSIATRYSKKLHEDIKRDVEKFGIDCVIADMLHVVYNCINVKKTIVLTNHNIEYKALETIARSTSNVFTKLIYFIESKKMKFVEESIWKDKRIKGHVFISSEDMKNSKCNENKKVIPMAYKVTEKVGICNKTEDVIVYTGKMDYRPNVDAITWFVKNIFNKILIEKPQTKFYIVGKNPLEEIKRLASDNIIVTGMVDSVEPYLQRAKIVVIPLLSGGGVKIKLFEAISTNNLVITTTKGIEGTSFKNNEDLIVEDKPEMFAKRCIDVLENYEQNIYLIENAIKKIKIEYDFENIAHQYYSFIEKSISK